jgi:hypothetical protein
MTDATIPDAAPLTEPDGTPADGVSSILSLLAALPLPLRAVLTDGLDDLPRALLRLPPAELHRLRQVLAGVSGPRGTSQDARCCAFAARPGQRPMPAAPLFVKTLARRM